MSRAGHVSQAAPAGARVRVIREEIAAPPWLRALSLTAPLCGVLGFVSLSILLVRFILDLVSLGLRLCLGIGLSGILFRRRLRLPRCLRLPHPAALVAVVDLYAELLHRHGLVSGADLDKYKDEEGDLCTLVEATIEDFLAQPSAKPLRLLASRVLKFPSR